MATIDNKQLPDFLVKEFKQIIDSIRPAVLLSYVRSRPELIKGFRPTQSNLNIIRKRLAGKVVESGEIDRGFLAFLAGESLNMELVAVFSERVILHLFPELSSYYGPKFMAAVLLDERENVRRLAFELLQADYGPTNADKAETAEIIQSELAPFLNHIAELLDKKHEAKEAVGSQLNDNQAAELKNSRKKIAALEKSLEEKGGENRAVKKIREKIQVKDDEIASVRDKLEREKAARKELQQKYSKKASELAELQETCEMKVQEGVEREMRAAVRHWLKKPVQREAVAAEIKNLENGDILVQVEDVLLRQAQVDRDCGNKKVLAHRLRKLEEARDKVIESSSDALSPLPDLSKIKKELDRKIAEIRGLFGTAKANAVVENLRIRINAAASPDALAKMGRLLTELEQNDIIADADLKELYMTYNRRMDFLYDRYVPSLEKSIVGSGPVWEFKNALHENRKSYLILDGHNVLFGLAALFADYYEDGVPSARAREKLLELLENMLQETQSMASVFFDGSVATERSYSRNVKEIYSGGGAAEVQNRADQAIIDYLTAVAGGENNVPVVVVTNDAELKRLVREKGAKTMTLAHFHALIAEFDA